MQNVAVFTTDGKGIMGKCYTGVTESDGGQVEGLKFKIQDV